MPQTTEHAFEAHVEEVLLGPGGWASGTNVEWDVERALFPARVCAFLEATQPALWARMRGLHAEGFENLIVRDEIELGEWVVMPNHFHGIVWITRDGRGDRPVAPTASSPRTG